MVKISDLRMREVINVADGRRLGPIKDIDIDLENGRISAIILPAQGSNRLFNLFGREDEIVVPWQKIKRIGVDVILVDLRDVGEIRSEGGSPPGGGERYF
ncbi:MAG: YlmC/YmxH family sporulation protein [Thermoanaerobacteraceae bacterium]|nr:YlmC/YmxH family sporulation protein [Thermoanaerobacteraceae bacterium]